MIERIDSPPDEGSENAYPILRTPAAKPIAGVTTSPNLIGLYTHYANNRTIPCTGKAECDFCNAGFSRRWHGYLGLILSPGLRHVIFEMTSTAAHQLKPYVQIYMTLRGCHLTASRPNGKPNGRVVLQTKRVDELQYRIPDPIDVWSILCHIWNIPTTCTELTPGAGPCLKKLDVHDNGRHGRHRAAPTR